MRTYRTLSVKLKEKVTSGVNAPTVLAHRRKSPALNGEGKGVESELVCTREILKIPFGP
jgi:hypothetical protein